MDYCSAGTLYDLLSKKYDTKIEREKERKKERDRVCVCDGKKENCEKGEKEKRLPYHLSSLLFP
jgi:hypothetical protein